MSVALNMRSGSKTFTNLALLALETRSPDLLAAFGIHEPEGAAQAFFRPRPFKVLLPTVGATAVAGYLGHPKPAPIDEPWRDILGTEFSINHGADVYQDALPVDTCQLMLTGGYPTAQSGQGAAVNASSVGVWPSSDAG